MNGGCISEKQIGKIISFSIDFIAYCTFPNTSNLNISCVLTDPAFDCVVPVLPTKSALHGGVLVPDSPQCGNNEKANLISH